MASPGMPSLFGAGWLFGIAIVTSLLWYLFWMVMTPVEQDVSWLVNWYFFMKLHLSQEMDFYAMLKMVHNWLPLLVITALILSKVAIIYRNYLLMISQLVYVVVISYNVFLVAFMVYAGTKVLQLFSVTLPLYVLVHCGPVLSQLFSPRTLWLPTSLFLLLYCGLCRRLPPSDKRSHKSCGLWDLSVVGAAKRVTIVFFVPVVMTGLTYWIMERGCLPCSSTPGFNARLSPPKPLLIGHRGCMFDFPENSLVAFESVASLPAIMGLETDIFISMDGIPYLLHDAHLIRTTDVQSKCPSHDPFSNSTLLYYHNGSCPLGKLNVARGFLESNSAKLSAGERTLYGSQHIPTFKQLLEIAKKNGKIVIFDVNKPPVGHPHHHSYLNRTLQDIAASGLPQNKVWWLPSENRQWVHQNYPNMIQATKAEVTAFKDLQKEHIQKMNEDWGIGLQQFRRYQDANLSINMFFVDSMFMYSYAWCVGVGTVTTSNCKQLSKVDTNPFLTICRQWHDDFNFSHSLLVGGLVIVLLQIVLLITWEALRLAGYWQGSAVKR